MSKLFNLKKWLTIPDAAKHFSIIFGEEVTEADVLRLGLDEKLTISLYLIQAIAKKAIRFQIPSKDILSIINSGDCYFIGDRATAILKIMSDEIIYLEGLVNLPMLGSERLIVEDKYRELSKEKINIREQSTLVCVSDEDGKLYVLQDNKEDSTANKIDAVKTQTPVKKSTASRENEWKICIGEPTIYVEQGAVAERRGNSNGELMINYQKENSSNSDIDGYINLNGFPPDSILVVRTEAIRKFEESIKPTGKVDEKRKEIIRILALIKKHDDQFNNANMPGIRSEFQEFCISQNKMMFQTSPDTFNDYLNGICTFKPGSRETGYYKRIATKLG